MRYTLRFNPLTQAIKRSAGKLLCRGVEAFVFVATTGRSGSTTLQKLCAAAPGCLAVRDAWPYMIGPVLESYNRGDESAVRREFEQVKLPLIYKRAMNHRWYVETNHAFIKCFADFAATALGPKLRVVHLVRDRFEVARSFLHKGSFHAPDHSFWVLRPDFERNVIRLGDDAPPARHEFLRCLWYWYESEARLLMFRRNHPAVPVFPVRTADFNDEARTCAFLHDLLGDFDDTAVRQLVGTRANRARGNTTPPPPKGLSQFEIESFDRWCRDRLEEVRGQAIA